MVLFNSMSQEAEKEQDGPAHLWFPGNILFFASFHGQERHCVIRFSKDLTKAVSS